MPGKIVAIAGPVSRLVGCCAAAHKRRVAVVAGQTPVPFPAPQPAAAVYCERPVCPGACLRIADTVVSTARAVAGVADGGFVQADPAIVVRIVPRLEVGEIIEIMTSIARHIGATDICPITLRMSSMALPATFSLAEHARQILETGAVAMARFAPYAAVHRPPPYRIAVAGDVCATTTGGGIPVSKCYAGARGKVVRSINVPGKVADGNAVGSCRDMAGITGKGMNDGVSPMTVRLR